MLVYVSGPYRGADDAEVEQNIRSARIAAVELWKRGHAVICPHANTSRFELECDLEPMVYIEGDLVMVARCDALVMIQGWERSQGAKIERDYAERLGIPIYTAPDYPDLHPTEVRCPTQVKAFAETLGQMHRIHLQKNADYCLAPGTKVLTGEMLWVPIENLVPGMTLVGFDEDVSKAQQSRRMYRPSVIERVSAVRLPSYRLHLEGGDEFIASAEHPWLVQTGVTSRWLTTERLQDAASFDRPSKLIKALDTWEPENDYMSGYLAAALDGEGWCSQQIPTGKNRHRAGRGFVLGFSQNDNPMLAQVRAILDDREIPYRVKFYRPNLVQLIFGKPRRDIIRLLGTVRPRRLLGNLDLNLGMVDLRRAIPLLAKECVGEQDLISIQTSTRTFLANGYATHNSPANIGGTGPIGVAVRLWDTVCRLLSLQGFRIAAQFQGMDQSREPRNEPIEDAWMDAANYGVIGYLNHKGLWGK